jgi:hypothetical protein
VRARHQTPPPRARDPQTPTNGTGPRRRSLFRAAGALKDVRQTSLLWTLHGSSKYAADRRALRRRIPRFDSEVAAPQGDHSDAIFIRARKERRRLLASGRDDAHIWRATCDDLPHGTGVVPSPRNVTIMGVYKFYAGNGSPHLRIVPLLPDRAGSVGGISAIVGGVGVVVCVPQSTIAASSSHESMNSRRCLHWRALRRRQLGHDCGRSRSLRTWPVCCPRDDGRHRNRHAA